jgi:hypothetical protein
MLTLARHVASGNGFRRRHHRRGSCADESGSSGSGWSYDGDGCGGGGGGRLAPGSTCLVAPPGTVVLDPCAGRGTIPLQAVHKGTQPLPLHGCYGVAGEITESLGSVLKGCYSRHRADPVDGYVARQDVIIFRRPTQDVVTPFSCLTLPHAPSVARMCAPLWCACVNMCAFRARSCMVCACLLLCRFALSFAVGLH